MKVVETWHSERLGQAITLARWGAMGRPVLLYPTAGGDAEEVERFGLIEACGALLAGGRIKIYSVDSVAGRTWVERRGQGRHCTWMQMQFDACVQHEVLPAIRQDCRGGGGAPLVCGASIGAFNALASLCRHPDDFGGAICMSGTYDLEPWLGGETSDDFYYCSPLHFLSGLDGAALEALRRRFVLLAFGQGRWEAPEESWRIAGLLGPKGIPNRVDPWGEEHDHDWPTWRRMLPQYLAELA